MPAQRRGAPPDKRPQSGWSAASATDQRRRVLAILGAAVAAAVGVAVLLIVLNRRGADDDPSSMTLRDAENPIAAGIPRDGRTIGDPAAPILVVEYADYQCPFCTGFGLTGLPKLLDEYVAPGTVRLEYHHFLVITADGPDGESARAAEAAECARDQGRFWDLHEFLIANSRGEYVGSFTPERIKEIAGRVDGLDQDAFGGCVDARTHAAEVVQMVEEGRRAGVRSTPTFVVNGEMVSGGYADLKAVVDAQLASA